jgi:hypothetical protein
LLARKPPQFVWEIYGIYIPRTQLFGLLLAVNMVRRRNSINVIDRALTKKFSDINTDELLHQNPNINTVEELINLFEEIYERKIYVEDTVTVIHFSEIIGE